MITVCPTCGHKTRVKMEPPRVTIRGTVYKVKKRTEIKQRLIVTDEGNLLYCPPIPLVIVRQS